MVIIDDENDLAFDHPGCFSPVVDQVVDCANEEQNVHYLMIVIWTYTYSQSQRQLHKYTNTNKHVQWSTK